VSRLFADGTCVRVWRTILAPGTPETPARRAAAVHVVSPSYFGAVSDVATLAEVADHGVPLIVDEAWGPRPLANSIKPPSWTKPGKSLAIC
jgi:hypothetical protein